MIVIDFRSVINLRVSEVNYRKEQQKQDLGMEPVVEYKSVASTEVSKENQYCQRVYREEILHYVSKFLMTRLVSNPTYKEFTLYRLNKEDSYVLNVENSPFWSLCFTVIVV